MNENEIDLRKYPPANRYMVTFESRHTTKGGGYAYQNQRRFVLADNANDAREFFRTGELANPKLWPAPDHMWRNLQAYHVPEYIAWPGYQRFAQDCRKNPPASE